MKNKINTIAKSTVPLYGIALVLNDLAKSYSKTKEEVANSPLSKAQEITKIKGLEARIDEMQAKIRQEYAIAQKIEDAVDVEIEEYYEVNGKSGVGVSLKDNSIEGGFRIEGNMITKRIYKFKGEKRTSIK